MKTLLLAFFLFITYANTAYGQSATTVVPESKNQKKVDREQHQLNDHRERLDKKEKNLDNQERVVHRNQKRLNTDQKIIDKERPVNSPPPAK